MRARRVFVSRAPRDRPARVRLSWIPLPVYIFVIDVRRGSTRVASGLGFGFGFDRSRGRALVMLMTRIFNQSINHSFGRGRSVSSLARDKNVIRVIRSVRVERAFDVRSRDECARAFRAHLRLLTSSCVPRDEPTVFSCKSAMGSLAAPGGRIARAPERLEMLVHMFLTFLSSSSTITKTTGARPDLTTTTTTKLRVCLTLCSARRARVDDNDTF